MASPLSAVLSGGAEMTVGENIFLLDCGQSADPDRPGADLTYTWECASNSHLTDCVDATRAPLTWNPGSPTQLVSLLGGHPSPLNYTVTCVVTSGSRSASATTRIRVTAGARPAVSVWLREAPGGRTAMVRAAASARANANARQELPCGSAPNLACPDVRANTVHPSSSPKCRQRTCRASPWQRRSARSSLHRKRQYGKSSAAGP